MTTSKPVHLKQEQAMYKVKNNCSAWALCCLGIALIVLGIGLSGCTKSAAHSTQAGFMSGNEAVNAFVNALREDNNEELLKIFGPESKELIWSGDKVSDQRGREMFLKAYDEQHRINAEQDKEVLLVGKNDWPFPIPLIKQNGKWKFDTASGKDEILNRRIGRNELDTIQTMLAVVDAEREYAAKDRQGDGIRQYAQKFRSDSGKKNGLYWASQEGQEQSPLGPLVSEARQEGYTEMKSSEKPLPYHGYFYRILTAQGAHADGGAFDYIVNGKMIGGFAVVAYPAEYGNSGIMTFMVNHDGVVYQKDLGSDTQQKAKAMERFDPDETWTKVQ